MLGLLITMNNILTLMIFLNLTVKMNLKLVHSLKDKDWKLEEVMLKELRLC